MKDNPLTKGMIEENSVGIGEISESMVAKRAKELSLIDGHRETKADHEQALSELTGGSELDEKVAFLESVSENERWNPLPGSRGHQAEEYASEDEDEDGRSESAQLFEEGVSEAGHDQMLESALKTTKEERSEE